MEATFKVKSSGITKNQRDQIVQKYKNIIKDYFDWAMVGDVQELVNELQKEIDNEVRLTKLDNILQNEFHKKDIEEGDSNR